jgi:hypothetical protein
MNRAHAFVLLLALFAAQASAQAPGSPASWLEKLTFTASATVNRVDNISRTSALGFSKDAETYEITIGAMRRQQLSSAWLMHAGIDGTFFAVPDYDLGNHLVAGPQIGLQRKFGLGPLAPVLQGDVSLAYKSARLAADRGWTTKANLRLGKRFASNFKAGVSGQWIDHAARSATFDLSQHSVSLDATWDITDRWSLAGSAGRLAGDIVANAPWAIWGQAISGGLGSTVFNYYTARPWEVTDLYGAGWVSYNVEADVDLWSAAVSYAFSDHTTAEFRYSSAFVVNKIGVRYPTDSWGLGVIHRF